MNIYLEKQLCGITSASIEKYLFLTGWKRDDTFQNKRLLVYVNNEDQELRLAIPSSENLNDFYVRLEGIIKTLSVIQARPEIEIIEALRSAYTDRIQFRIINESTAKGKLPLDYAAKCLEGLRDLVLYAACAEENARPVCTRAYNNAKTSLERFQFGQTGYGSFVINVEVQVATEENEQQYLLEVAPTIPEPNEHKIIKRINTAIQQVDLVVNREVKVSELIEYGYKDGITANMCDALSKLNPLNKSDIEIETTVQYAEAITHSVNPPVKNTLESDHFLYFEEISKRYKDCSLIEDVTMTGTIKMLSKDNDADGGETENTVRLLTRVESKMRSITLHLSPQNHIAACDAYRDDREVEVVGILDKSGKRWFFSEVSSFTVL